VADATQGELSLKVAADSTSDTADTTGADFSIAEHATGESNIAAPPNDGQTETALTIESLDGQSIVANGDNLAVADTSQQSSASSQDQPQENPQDNEPPSIKLDSASAASQTSDPTAATTANKTPSAIAPAAQVSASDAPQNTAGSTPPNSLSNAAPPRARLPADVLTAPAGTPQRRTNVEVDATRLITRVARAFSAAQERDGEIRLRLSPPELGSLRLDVRVQDGALVARLQTETDAARTAILDNLPALRERLLEQGVRIERFDIDLMQRQPGGMPDQPGGRQQDSPAAPIHLVSPPPRPRSESAASTVPSTASVGPAGGLNVIV
jgi:flagellar hook-length control protein FliK